MVKGMGILRYMQNLMVKEISTAINQMSTFESTFHINDEYEVPTFGLETQSRLIKFSELTGG